MNKENTVQLASSLKDFIEFSDQLASLCVFLHLYE